MDEIKNYKATIAARVQEHYDYLVAAGYEVVFTALQGSQNYGLDEYSNEYQSDVDTKSVILPSLEDFIRAKPPISTTIVLDNEEHAEVKDIRVMFEMFKKENISYIELLYSDYIVFNPKYEELIKPIFNYRDKIATADTTQFLKCIAGMAYEKNKALCHPYPGIIEKIEKYGYDGKQLSHCVRLHEFITRFAAGTPVAAVYKTNKRELLMNYKKQLNEEGLPLSKDEAIALSEFYCAEVKCIKDKLIKENNYEVDKAAALFLDEIKANILKFKITEDVRADMIINVKNLGKWMVENIVKKDDDFEKKQQEMIDRIKVSPLNNFWDYYKEK